MSYDFEKIYSRQLSLKAIGRKGQKRIGQSSVMIIGCGALGTMAAMQLGGLGVGKITLVDHDRIEMSNLHRQLAYGYEDVGDLKAQALGGRLKNQYPYIKVNIINAVFDENIVLGVLPDFVLDCTDSSLSRNFISSYFRPLGIPVVFGGVSRFFGQVSIWADNYSFDSINPFENSNKIEDKICTIAPVIGLVASIMVIQTLSLILEWKSSLLIGKLLTVNCLNLEMRTYKLISKS
jgi:molybdopterin/thiamine biosynthesis adenylyltransferase